MSGIITILVFVGIYFIPTIFGWEHKDKNAIFILNLFLGWTFIGWVIALIWAVKN